MKECLQQERVRRGHSKLTVEGEGGLRIYAGRGPCKTVHFFIALTRVNYKKYIFMKF